MRKRRRRQIRRRTLNKEGDEQEEEEEEKEEKDKKEMCDQSGSYEEEKGEEKEEEGAVCHSSCNEMNHAIQVASISLHNHSHRDIPLRSISENTQFYYPVKLYTAQGLLISPQLQ